MPSSKLLATVLSARQTLIIMALALGLGACVQTSHTAPPHPGAGPAVQAMYGPVMDAEEMIPAVDVSKMDPENIRQIVNYRTPYPPGTIVVDPHARFLYLVMENSKAMRYGVGVAKAGLEFEGEADVARKARWPGWVPTPGMIQREPERYGHLAQGMPGGIENPLGARALYLYKDGKDTLYRIHGTNETWSIGQSVSSGCIRLLNQDIIDLHSRVPKGSRVVVLGPEHSGKGEF
ncbi:Probable L,D-transpeptidase ErfK/SrfK precursor [Pannonibacter phragmitetus]|uniref:Probable L,D-transpeptidase ErfK/SrfK n=1 Tax=Pannonibacter phragmitetus TaxID=121719 RepID=A0A378ZTU5_9HYPH|nr:L,D-transpeptidase [Pannonibacter phragmitetus]SUB00645.1 Probable L,D-transpeptidase ErfK/SrfK precursor [Pannonibacter phragmitetus]